MNLLTALRRGAFVPNQPGGTFQPSSLLQHWQTWGTAGSDREPLGHGYVNYVTAGYQTNGVVFAVILARMMLFSEVELTYQDRRTKELEWGPGLDLLETPWPNGTTGELFARMEQDVSLAGNSYVRRAGPDRLERLRPDWVDILLMPTRVDGQAVIQDVAGYLYWPHGVRGADRAELILVEDMAHWSPIPDPLATFRGMSWLTPVIREINSDTLMTDHKIKFFENAATPNAWIKVEEVLKKGERKRLRDEMDQRYAGVANAHKTLIIDGGADYNVIGNTFQEMSFETVQAAGENRIAAAGGVPGIVAGLKEGLEAATYSNFKQAMRKFTDLHAHPHWRSACAALQKFATPRPGKRLWFDTRGIAALEEGEKERAEINRIRAETASVLVRAGYEPALAARVAATGEGLSLLAHTGTIPTTVQLPEHPDDKPKPTSTGDDE